MAAEYPRQQGKVKHLMKDITAIVFFAEPANAIEIYLFAQANEKLLREHLELPEGIQYSGCLQ